MTTCKPINASSVDMPADIFVLYGTETGNAKIVAFEAIKTLTSAGFTPRVLGLNEIKPGELTKLTHAIFIVSTSGDGDMPYNAIDFWDALKGDDCPRFDGLRYGTIALGESVYEEFCAAGRAIDERLHGLGATRLVDRVECDYDFEEHAATWLEEAIPILASSIATSSPAAPGLVVVSNSVDEGRPTTSAIVSQKLVLTRADADREVVHYSIEVDVDAAGKAPFDWQPGDSLNLFYANDPNLVHAILERLGLAADARIEGYSKRLGELLAQDFEIRTISRDLAGNIAQQSGDKELSNWIVSATQTEFNRWRETNDLLQLLLDHPSAGFDGQSLLLLLRRLMPRAYSIASSPKSRQGNIDLSVRTVEYVHGDRKHRGVVSGGLSSRSSAGESILVQHVATPSFRLPDDPAADIVMVGAGVGVAPFRAFLHHRVARGDTGRNWLFHGIRHPQEDELYGSEFAAWRDSGTLHSYEVCASRISEGRRYVQDGMLERGSELFSYLEAGGYLYVCGDAHNMAKSVRSTLRQIAADALGSIEKGEFFVEGLQAQRRYRQDVY